MSQPDDSNTPVEEERRRWFSLACVKEQGRPSDLHLSSPGLLLQLDVQRAFVARAWASVVVMAQAVIESTIRDVETGDYDSKAKQLFQGDPDLERVRLLRNELLHSQPPETPSMVWVVAGGDVAACHALLEEHAKHAVRQMFRAVFMTGRPNPSVKGTSRKRAAPNVER